jgi:hypothetical protein
MNKACDPHNDSLTSRLTIINGPNLRRASFALEVQCQSLDLGV